MEDFSSWSAQGAHLDYDRLHDLANQHASVRVMLMTGVIDPEYWSAETIQENVRLLTPEIINKINILVVKFGHSQLKTSIRKSTGRTPHEKKQLQRQKNLEKRNQELANFYQ